MAKTYLLLKRFKQGGLNNVGLYSPANLIPIYIVLGGNKYESKQVFNVESKKCNY